MLKYLDDEFSKKVKKINFYCCCMIVLFHASNIQYYGLDNSASLLGKAVFCIEKFISINGYCIAIPLFFIMSGFWFYKGFDNSKILTRYKSRFFSLVIPYIVWNILFTVLWSLIEPEAVVIDSIPTALKTIFLYHFNSIFWYIYQLIIFTIACPIIFFVVKNKKMFAASIGLLCVYLAICKNDLSLLTVKIDSLLYYLIGAFLGVHYCEIPKIRGTVRHVACAAVLFFLAQVYLIFFDYELYHPLTDAAVKLILCYAFWYIVDVRPAFKIHRLEAHPFFIYASQYLVLIPIRVYLRPLFNKTPLVALIFFFVSAALGVVIPAFIALILQKRRRLWMVLTGNR